MPNNVNIHLQPTILTNETDIFTDFSCSLSLYVRLCIESLIVCFPFLRINLTCNFNIYYICDASLNGA